ncbi:MAG: hypothetical protein ACKOAH_33350, partial [Pirellula sp.]
MSASMIRFVSFFVVCSLLACLFTQASFAQLVDPAAESLKSWNDCSTKRALIAYVQRVCDPKSSEFVPESERLSVFDNDGTLWPEN